VVALLAVPESVVLIAGGRRVNASGADFEEMVGQFFSDRVKAVLLIGEVAPIIRSEFYIQKKRNPGLGPEEIRSCKNLKEAVRAASRIAASGEVVLLSPGAESFGEFRDYRDRGNCFKGLVNQLKKSK
jgi:UDP-N-acetylmuramoylalanine--D-glutamate ligase